MSLNNYKVVDDSTKNSFSYRVVLPVIIAAGVLANSYLANTTQDNYSTKKLDLLNPINITNNDKTESSFSYLADLRDLASSFLLPSTSPTLINYLNKSSDAQANNLESIIGSLDKKQSSEDINNKTWKSGITGYELCDGKGLSLNEFESAVSESGGVDRLINKLGKTIVAGYGGDIDCNFNNNSYNEALRLLEDAKTKKIITEPEHIKSTLFVENINNYNNM